VDKRNSDGIKAEITALKHGHHEAADLLARLTNVSKIGGKGLKGPHIFHFGLLKIQVY
jgi:hypothetical protein